MFAQNRRASDTLVQPPVNSDEEEEEEDSRPGSVARTLPEYEESPTETNRIGHHDLQLAMNGQIDQLPATLNRFSWPENQGARPQVLLSELHPNLEGTGPAPITNGTQPQPTAVTSTAEENPYLSSATVQQSKRIAEAMESGDAVYALHNKTLQLANGDRIEQATQTRLQNVHLGELVLKTMECIRTTRKCCTISERTERSQLDRALQLSLKLQGRQISLALYWSSMVGIVQELQYILSKHYLELGLEELAININDVENRMAMRNVVQ